MNSKREKRGRNARILLWIFICLYVATLPYAIVLFDFLEEFLSLRVVRILPFFVLSFFCAIYLWVCRLKGRGYGLIGFVLPSTVFFLAVFLLESNSIKYIHIPEYALLTGLIYLAISRDDNSVVPVVASALFASALGVFDEVHQGIHPGRYFGWKDMIINTVGATIGAMAINVFGGSRAINIVDCLRPLKQPLFEILILAISTLVTAFSVTQLFAVSQQSSFSYAYSSNLVSANVISICACLVIALRNYRNIGNDLTKELVLFFPASILMAIQVLICISYFQGFEFR